MIFPIEISPYNSPAYSSLTASHCTSIKGQYSLMQSCVWSRPSLTTQVGSPSLPCSALSAPYTLGSFSSSSVPNRSPSQERCPLSSHFWIGLSLSCYLKFKVRSNINPLGALSSLLWWTLCLTQATPGKMCMILFTSLRKTCNDSTVLV